MRVEPIHEHAHRLTALGFVNAYLVQEYDGFTLIDAMMGDNAQGVLALCASLGAPLRRMLLTHAHTDHIGCVDASTTQLPGIALAVGRRESRMLAKPPEQSLALLPGEPGRPGMRMNFPGVMAAATQLLSPGNRFGSLFCIATPGHTPGHISFLDKRDATLYTGDAMGTGGGSPHLPGCMPWYFPLPPKFSTWHYPTAIASVEELLELPIRRFAPGHGPVVEGGTELLEAALAEVR